MAEAKAYWRALMVLCPETARLTFKKQTTENKISLDVVAASLRLPANHMRDLMRGNFDQIAKGFLK
jgi:hypothetical protein